MTLTRPQPIHTPRLTNAQPLVSILIANFNYERFIGAALEGLSAQTYPYFEALVCDDGSVDGSLRVIRVFQQKDPRIKVIEKENGGVASALNRAFATSTGEIICLLDADDVFVPHKLQVVLEAFKRSDWGLLVHPMTVINGRGRRIQRKPAFSSFEQGWIADRVIQRGGRWTYMEASAVCLKRALAERVFPLPEETFRTWADTYICVLSALLAPVGFIDEELTLYRLHGSNVSGFSSVSREQALGAMNGVRRVATTAHERLEELGHRADLLPKRNLTYVESELLVSLLDVHGSRAACMKKLRNYAQMIRHDSIYTPVRKFLTLFFFATSIPLPRQLRSYWISLGLTESRAKEMVRRLIVSPRRGLMYLRPKSSTSRDAGL